MIYNTGNYYIKRCVGLPGDTLSMEDGKWDVDSKLGSRKTIYIPKQGDTIPLNKDNYMLYWRCMDYETRMDLEYKDSTFFFQWKKIGLLCVQEELLFYAGR